MLITWRFSSARRGVGGGARLGSNLDYVGARNSCVSRAQIAEQLVFNYSMAIHAIKKQSQKSLDP